MRNPLVTKIKRKNKAEITKGLSKEGPFLKKGGNIIKIKLESDFLDYYDHWFDFEGQAFKRHSSSGMSRSEMFDFLEQIGVKTPPHGSPQQVFNQIGDSTSSVVVYINQYAHRGEGKILLPILEAIQKYPSHLCSLYYPTLPTGSESFRYLQIGDKRYWLRYTSSDWRSNYGDTQIEILSQKEDGFHSNINLPLFAIDFITDCKIFCAIDFNIAPGVRHTGIEDILPAKEAAAAIKRWFRLNAREVV